MTEKNTDFSIKTAKLEGKVETLSETLKSLLEAKNANKKVLDEE